MPGGRHARSDLFVLCTAILPATSNPRFALEAVDALEPVLGSQVALTAVGLTTRGEACSVTSSLLLCPIAIACLSWYEA